MSYTFTTSYVPVKRKGVVKLVPQQEEECYTVGKILSWQVTEDTIMSNKKPVLRQVYHLKTDGGSLRITEITTRNIMKKCLESGGKIQFAPYGPVIHFLEMNPECSISSETNLRDQTTLFIEFQDKNMVSPKKTTFWSTAWAFVNGKQVV